MSTLKYLSIFFIALLLVTGCGSDKDNNDDEVVENNLNEILAAKTPFALAKGPTPVLNTHDWDGIFGGDTGDALKYDQYGEIDEVVFVARENTFFNLQRQIRKETRGGTETIYYKVTTSAYKDAQDLWVDGRFLDLRDIRPRVSLDPVSVARTLINLRSYEGLPYTWHGGNSEGISELLLYYPPSTDISDRTRDDWMLKGFDTLGMLYEASGGQTPLELKTLARFGDSVLVDFSKIDVEDITAEGEAAVTEVNKKKAQLLAEKLRPLDIIQMSDRIWVVLDDGEVIQSKYRSKFDGGVQITSLFDTTFGLLEKATYVKDSFVDLDDKNTRKFFIRRYVSEEELVDAELIEEEDLVEDEEVVEDDEEEEVVEDGEEGSEETEGDAAADEGATAEEGGEVESVEE